MAHIVRPREVLYFLLGIAALEVLQSSYFPAGRYLDFPLVIVTYIGWYSSAPKGAGCGIGLGLVQDFFLSPYLGLNGLSKTAVGFISAYLSKWIAWEGFLPRMVLITLLSLLDSAMVYGMLALLNPVVTVNQGIDVLLRSGITGVGGGALLVVYERVKLSSRDFRRPPLL